MSSRPSGGSRILAAVNSAAVNSALRASLGSCFSPDMCPGVGLQDHMAALFLVSKEPPYCSPEFVYQYAFLLTVREGSLLSNPLQHLLLWGFLMIAILTGVR